MASRLLLALFAGTILVAPAVAQERQWALDASGEDAYLVFGVPDTDDVGVSLWCSIQQGDINVFVPDAAAGMKAGTKVKLTIGTDRRRAQFIGRVEVNAEASVSSIEALVPAGHPIFDAMLKADSFYVRTGRERKTFPLFDADLAGLMELCRKP